jgi:hypothetical protein
VTEIDTLFGLLDAWRHFPSYPLERRADLYFALYLPEVLEAQFGFPVQPQLVPEFPLRIGTLDPDKTTSASYKVDYVALSAARDKALLVELKTDLLSRRDRQDAYLLAAQQVGLHGLLAGLLDVFRRTKAQRKYFCLLEYLEALEMLHLPETLPETLREIMARSSLRGARTASRQVEILVDPAETRVVYVQPQGERENVINFRAFAEVVARHDDALSRRFARSLQEWASVQAGES